MLYLGTEGLMRRLNFVFTDGKTIQHSNPLYHPGQMKLFVHGFPSLLYSERRIALENAER